MVGVGAFLIAHLAFIMAFIQRTLRIRLVGVTAIPVLASSGIIAAWLLPHVPSGDWPMIVAYMGVISCMWLMAGGAAHDTVGRLAFIGATVFFVSDIFVARWRYVDSSSINAFICYPLYYTACLILAWSSYLQKRDHAG